jgi:translocation and assembly module TamA
MGAVNVVPKHWIWVCTGVITALAFALVTQAQAFDDVQFSVEGGDKDLTKSLRNASLIIAAQSEDDTDAQDLFAAARGEYGRLLGALYARGHYSGVIRVLIDGREAAEIAPLDAPTQINEIQVFVDPGPQFAFSTARVAPVETGTQMPDGFATGKPAESGLIALAVTAGVDGWRATGHAKAAPTAQTITADHNANTLAADVTLTPGPRLRFGSITVTGQQRMRERRIRKIMGLKEGETFDPAALQRAADRLRRTGVFSSVTLTEADTITAPDLLGITANVVEDKPRRYSIGAEIASLEGLKLSGYWLHRNLLGGAERFKIEGAISNIGAQSSGVDYTLGVTLDRPATLSADTTLRFHVDIAHLDEEDYRANLASIGVGFSHIFSETLSARVGIDYNFIDGSDELGDFRYRNLGLPLGVTWDRRDSKTDATRGFYLDAEARPFLGFGTTDSGLHIKLDARAYRALGDRLVIAGRIQGGAIFGASLLGSPRDDLFYSGGGGTVRGQPYQSLGIAVPDGAGGTYNVGGTRFIAGSLELRAKITDTIGVVGFIDAGQVTDADYTNAGDNFHAGAGLGLRYATGFGPIRFDVATPVGGDTGKGVQLYVGIGQSF